MPHACPDCGAPVSERAAVCPQCGFPIRRDDVPGRGPGGRPGARPSSGNQARVLIIALVAGGVFMLVVMGVLAALAIPRFAEVTRRAKEMEGERLLKQVYAMEQLYRQEHGTYTSDLQALRMGSLVTSTARFYEVRVSAAGENELCLEAVP